MARSRSVWGIDIGQSALKALRCRYVPDTQKLQAEAFAFIEYPKLLSQPDAEPLELIRDALAQFTARHVTKGDRVALGVSGQSGLAKFIKLPPVEPKKIPDIVKWEAKQQIPFDLKDVIWDYQQLSNSMDEGGYSTDTVVGLFAMKRDQVLRALAPLQNAKIEVDLVQLMPLAVCNYLLFDQPQRRNDNGESTVIVSMGTDTTDLVVCNGQPVWQRSIPTGGSAFTKALTKEMKLTFAKAEHLKRNVGASPDGKAALQAMKNTCMDFAAEINRSLNYYRSIDRKAKIARFVGLGNPFRLPGLQKFLQQQLELPFEVVTSFERLEGAEVVDDPAFQSNLASFAVCYGLVAQGTGQGAVQTNLVPRDLVNQRIIREKQPWTVAGLAALMLGCVGSYCFSNAAFSSTQQPEFSSAMASAEEVAKRHADIQAAIASRKETLESLRAQGAGLVGNTEGRLNWLELYKAIVACMPKDDPPQPGPNGEPPQPIPLSKRNVLYITSIDAKQYGTPGAASGGESSESSGSEEESGSSSSSSSGSVGGDLSEWWATAKFPLVSPTAVGFGAAPAPAPTVSEPAAEESAEPDATTEEPAEGESEAVKTPSGPSGSGWVIQINGYHFHHEDVNNRGAVFVRNTLVKNLSTMSVELPTGEGDKVETVTLADLGIQYPVLRYASMPVAVTVKDPIKEAADKAKLQKAQETGETIVPEKGPDGVELQPGEIAVKRCDFKIQFAWKPTPRTERKRLQAEAKRKAEEAASGESAAEGANEADGDAAAPAADETAAIDRP